MRLVLASASPRRAELLNQLGVSFEIKPADIDETVLENEKPENYVARMAREKAEKAWGDIELKEQMTVLAADTSVVVDQYILCKPNSFDDFKKMMEMLSDREHQVYTALTVISKKAEKSILNRNFVQFRTLSEQDITTYWQSGEPRDKAGGYGIQGLGAQFIPSIEGSYTGIMGLPLYETAEILSDFGILVGNKA